MQSLEELFKQRCALVASGESTMSEINNKIQLKQFEMAFLQYTKHKPLNKEFIEEFMRITQNNQLVVSIDTLVHIFNAINSKFADLEHLLSAVEDFIQSDMSIENITYNGTNYVLEVQSCTSGNYYNIIVLHN